jgi:hypothetical protein
VKQSSAKQGLSHGLWLHPGLKVASYMTRLPFSLLPSPFSILDLGHRLSYGPTSPTPLHPLCRCLHTPAHGHAGASASSSALRASASATETHHQRRIWAATPVQPSTTSSAPRPPLMPPHARCLQAASRCPPLRIGSGCRTAARASSSRCATLCPSLLWLALPLLRQLCRPLHCNLQRRPAQRYCVSVLARVFVGCACVRFVRLVA